MCRVPQSGNIFQCERVRQIQSSLKVYILLIIENYVYQSLELFWRVAGSENLS